MLVRHFMVEEAGIGIVNEGKLFFAIVRGAS